MIDEERGKYVYSHIYLLCKYVCDNIQIWRDYYKLDNCAIKQVYVWRVYILANVKSFQLIQFTLRIMQVIMYMYRFI